MRLHLPFRAAACALPPLLLAAVFSPLASQAQAPRVGPPRGTVIVVGGGQIGPDIYARFIAAAGGPDALIVDVPTAGGDSVYPASWRGANPWRRAGARNVVVLHTIDRKVADSDSFAAVLRKAGGVWFEGGRQWHLVDSYAGTKTEREFHNVLARGGVVGGSSAGASILSSYLLRGARSGNTIIMAPGYEVGFGFLRGVAIDQHVVARERLRDLADSLMPKHPELLGISEDEGTAWVVTGDTALIMGRNRAFAYGGKETDPGRPFVTLHPGDRYDLAARHVLHRALADSPLTEGFVDSLMAGVGPAPAAVLVAQGGKVLISKSYNIPDRPNWTPTTTVPNFQLGGLSAAFTWLLAQMPATAGATEAQLITRRIYTPIGAHKTTADTASGARRQFASSVDELYRFELGLENPAAFLADTTAATNASDGMPILDVTRGWNSVQVAGADGLALYGTPEGKRHAFVRIPGHGVAVIVLSENDALDAKGVAEVIASRLLGGR